MFFFAGLNIQARKSVNTYFKIDVNLYIYIYYNIVCSKYVKVL